MSKREEQTAVIEDALFAFCETLGDAIRDLPNETRRQLADDYANYLRALGPKPIPAAEDDRDIVEELVEAFTD